MAPGSIYCKKHKEEIERKKAQTTEQFKTSTNHTGLIEVKNKLEETDDIPVYSGDIYCKGCGIVLIKGNVILVGFKEMEWERLKL